MAGHLQKRSKNSWTIYIEMGRDTEGKRKRLCRAFKGTKKEAEKEMARLLLEIDSGQYIEPTKLTFGDYLLNWLTDYGKSNLANTTYYSYQKIIEKHIIPEIGGILLQKLQPMHLQKYYSLKLDSLSKRTVQYHHRVIREALKHAVQLQAVTRNVADAVAAPKPQRPEINMPSIEKINEFLVAASEHQDWSIIYTTLLTGMRRGEVMGLRWSDVDFKQKVLHVRQTLQRLPKIGFYFAPPKSKKSRRPVVMPEALIEVLKNHRKKQMENMLEMGEHYQDNNLVFCRPDGTPEDPSRLNHRYKDLVDGIGMNGFRFHDLRHLHPTLLMEQHVHPKIVQERLGHQTFIITLDLYTHSIPTMQREAAEKINESLGKQIQSLMAGSNRENKKGSNREAK
ncbi:MAG: tyrosine-type recombinase/integrase [Clostridia bacterium]|nr:tyrosine-type recombinase/integrase [Clostridia bacterium]